jgi:acetyl esterase/lipase
MASVPRLPTPVEHRFLKGACQLPPRLQRRLFGPPPRIDGQVLASDVHALIGVARLSGVRSYTNGLPPAQARLANRSGTAAAAADPPIPMELVEAVEVPSEAGPIAARLYRPGSLPSAPAPLLVYYHGGGWVIGDLDTHDGVCRFLAAAAGVAVLAVDYRLAPEHPFPAAVQDALAAFLWASGEGAERLGVDAARIAVGGDSAGGNLATVVARVAREAGEAAPAMQLLLYPVTDSRGEFPSRRLFAEGFMLTRVDIEMFDSHYLPADSDRTDPRVAVLEAPDLSGLAPAYLATAGFDPLRDEGEAYGRRMREAGVRVAARRHPGLIHGFANQTAVSRTARAAMREAAGALRMGLAAPGAS